MISQNSMLVNATAAQAWTLIGDEFVAVDRWMAAIPTAEAIPGPALPGAPAKGRNSYLIQKFAPLYQEEILTAFDPQNKTISVDVTLRKGPRMMPMKGYTSTVLIEEVDARRCKVTWIGKAKAKWFAKPMQSLFTKSLDPGFIRSLEEIQHFLETGAPHPRKIEKIKSEAALAA